MIMLFILYNFIWISDATKDADAFFQKQMLATRLRHKDNIFCLMSILQNMQNSLNSAYFEE